MATAAALVDGDPAPASAPPAAQPPVPSALPFLIPSLPPDRCQFFFLSSLCDAHCNYKNILQELLQRAHMNLPKYYTECKGPHHQPKFRCIVKVDGEEFSSDHCHSRIKDAEQDSARAAYDILVRRDANVTDVLELIDQDVVFSKSILHEFAVKTAANQPSYSVSNPEGLGPMTLFVASVLFSGNTYTGEPAINKKDAEQKAARAVVKSVLATKNTCMAQIIRSKKKLITAISSPGYNKERGVVGQEINNSPTGGPSDMVPASQPISSPPLAVQEPHIMPGADPSSNPSAQAMHVSKKRKRNKIRGPESRDQ
ncbi:hypothetical protein ABZP36_025154 [Zizania latifolia]